MTKEEMRTVKRNTVFETLCQHEETTRKIKWEVDETKKKDWKYRFATRCGEFVERFLPMHVRQGNISQEEAQFFFNRIVELARQVDINVTDDAYGKGIRFFVALDLSNWRERKKEGVN